MSGGGTSSAMPNTQPDQPEQLRAGTLPSDRPRATVPTPSSRAISQQKLQGNKITTTTLRIANFWSRHGFRLARTTSNRRAETEFLLMQNREGAGKGTKILPSPQR